MVARGANLHARTEPAEPSGVPAPGRITGLTPFLTAARAGDLEMMQALIDLGAEPAARSNEGAGAVLLAIRSRDLAPIQRLVELGLDLNLAPPGRPTALHTAIRLGEDEIVEYLVAHGADLQALDHHGRTPLEEAEFEAPTPTIELMRRLTADRPEDESR
jgi:ankyrin repeat protein